FSITTARRPLARSDAAAAQTVAATTPAITNTVKYGRIPAIAYTPLDISTSPASFRPVTMRPVESVDHKRNPAMTSTTTITDKVSLRGCAPNRTSDGDNVRPATASVPASGSIVRSSRSAVITMSQTVH